MKKIILILFSLSIAVHAQLRLTIDTDKDVYDYGEKIKIYCTLYNDADTSVTFLASNYNTCQAEFILNDYNSRYWELCLPTVEEITFPPHSQRIYSWEIDPYVFGIPGKDGEQTLIGYFNQGWNTFNTDHLKDTTTFYSPMFLGGQLEVNYPKVTQSEVDSIRKGFDAEVIEHTDFDVVDKSSEIWQLTSIHIDSAYNVLISDSLFISIQYNRFLRYDSIFVTSVKKVDDLEKGFTLSQNYPNPFNPNTTIKFTIPSIVRRETQYVKLIVYDILGREVRVLLNKKLSPGSYEVEFNGSNLSSGIYFYRLKNGEFSQTKKMILIK